MPHAMMRESGFEEEHHGAGHQRLVGHDESNIGRSR